jgi:hypothetical protein
MNLRKGISPACREKLASPHHRNRIPQLQSWSTRSSHLGGLDSSLARSVDRSTRKNASSSGACFIPRRSGYRGKIARSNAELSTTLKLAPMGRPAISMLSARIVEPSSTLSLAPLASDSCTRSPCGRAWFSRYLTNAPPEDNSRRTCLTHHRLPGVPLPPREQ